MYYLIFLNLFFSIANKHVFYIFLEKLRGKKVNRIKSTDKSILNLIHKKTGLRLNYFWIYDTDEFWGLMAGLPGWPQMFLSTYAIDSFTKDELEWVILHEAGHYVLWHTTRELIAQIILAGVGLYILRNFHNHSFIIFIVILLSLFLGMIAIQISKWHEYEAENFALKRMDNPEGMIASGKRSLAHKKWGKRRNIVVYVYRRLFYRWEISMYYKRIIMAQKEIILRKAK